MARSQLQASPFLLDDIFKVGESGGAIEDGARQDYNAESASQNYVLGTRGFVVNTDRVYRYGGFTATAVVAGAIIAPDISVGGVVDTDNIVDAAEAIGQTEILMDGAAFTSITANQFAGAIFAITANTGEGHQYPIVSNTASVNTDEVTLTLARPIRVALDTTSDMMILPNPFANMLIATVATDGAPSGVTCLAITASYYAWVQRRGMATVLLDDTGSQQALYRIATLSDGIDGACQGKDADTEPIIGYFVVLGDDTDYAGVYLTLE